MNINNYGLYLLNYTIVFCTSSDPNFPIDNINKKSRYSEMIPINNSNNIDPVKAERLKNLYFNCGWSSLRYCTYPQMIITQLSSMSDIKQINIEINHERIPQKIDVYVYCPTIFKEVVTNLKNILNAEFTYIGSVIPVYHNKNQREIKKLIFHQNERNNQIIIKNCLYIKFIIHKNYENKQKNKFNQVGIINIDILGNNTTGKILPVLPLQKVEKFKIDEILPRLKGLYTDNDYDNYIKEKIQKAKNEYYNNSSIANNEAKKNKIYEDIQMLRELGKKVIELKKERVKFEYFKNDQKLIQIDLKLKEIKKYIENEYPYYGKENIIYDNGMEYDETQEFQIKKVETDLGEENEINNENNNEINFNDEDEIEEKIVENGNDLMVQKQNNENGNNYYNMNNQNQYQVSAKSKEILRRHLEKKRMIKENMEIAELNRKIDINSKNSNIVV